MRIKHLEIGNFRKLKAVRVDFSPEKTVFVGANNSGKTTAMLAMSGFLVDASGFSVTDFTLSHWPALNASAKTWEAAVRDNQPLPAVDWSALLPFMDVWLDVNVRELHFVQKLLPTLDWNGGLLGVRLRFEPKDAEALQHDFLQARAQVAATLAGVATGTEPVVIAEIPATPEAQEIAAVVEGITEGAAAPPTVRVMVSLWPQSMVEFLDRRMRGQFTVKGYVLDPAKLTDPVGGLARPQKIGPDEPIDGDPFKGLIRIDEISAQRGFGTLSSAKTQGGDQVETERPEGRGVRRLSAQLRSYYSNHLDPYEMPEPKDLDALHALEKAREAFDERLKACFAGALKELEEMGYPGVTDPKLTLSTRMKPTDGLSHASAVLYEVPTQDGEGAGLHRLPEGSNGLGYQNLVSMVFGLMSYRDAWMRVGKAGSKPRPENAFIPPLHLVLVEEPEAYLHAQVQQVFINQAYAVLRNHKDLADSTHLTTQLVVSTHSSHIAHACDFAALRYFRRLPAPAEPGAVPLSSVVNLSEVFGGADQTERFVTRYLKASHCDLFFADAVVLIEGPAERILVPYFVEARSDFEFLRRCYVTWLEIGGSHAHRLRRLIEHLGINTLIITDIDAQDGVSRAAVPPRRGAGQKARNETLKTWVPGKEALDELLDAGTAFKTSEHASGYGVRAAYQSPVQAKFKADWPEEALANTFEDAILYENIAFFAGRPGAGLIGKFRGALEEAGDIQALAASLHSALASGGKAEFALDLLYADDIDKLIVPAYIRDGLLWLIEQLRRKERELAGVAAAAV